MRFLESLDSAYASPHSWPGPKLLVGWDAEKLFSSQLDTVSAGSMVQKAPSTTAEGIIAYTYISHYISIAIRELTKVGYCWVADQAQSLRMSDAQPGPSGVTSVPGQVDSRKCFTKLSEGHWNHLLKQPWSQQDCDPIRACNQGLN